MVRTEKQIKRLAVGIVAISGISLGGLAVASTITPASAADSSSGTITITANVKNSLKQKVDKVNDSQVDGEEHVIETYNKLNSIIFATNFSSNSKILYGDKVLWRGETEGSDKPVTATFELPNGVGIYELTIVSTSKTTGEVVESKVKIQFKATIPSVLPGNTDNNEPGAPNTGAYVQLAGRAISVSSIALAGVLLGVLLFLISVKGKKEAKAPVVAVAKQPAVTVKRRTRR